jgi:predicted aspartyl protease
MSPRALASIVALNIFGYALPAVKAQNPDRATVPLTIQGNRPFIQITFRKPDGTVRTGRFLLDTGGGGFLITEPLARDLGLQWGTTMREGGREFAAVTVLPKAYVGEFPLALNSQRTAVMIGSDNMLPRAAPGHADGMVPGHVLAQYHVVFDYPNATFTIARPGVLVPKGAGLSMPVGKQSGFPRTEINVNGSTYGLLLDTGASFTMVSEALLKTWGERHPEWPRHAGAFGEAATLGGQTLETMFVPSALWGTQALQEFGVVSQQEGTFEEWMSRMMAAPILGALAGNVLKLFRVELDYAHERLYLSRRGE